MIEGAQNMKKVANVVAAIVTFIQALAELTLLARL